MPRHVDDLRNSDSFPVKPATNEYHALSLLVANREFGFTPAEIADRTTVSEASASKTMTRLFEKGLVERAQGSYYAEPERADELKRRLDSLDATARLFETAPDDAYAEPGWETQVPSIDPDDERTRAEDERTTVADADELVSDLTDSDDGA
jgi:DNA-binding MarR family transcriptional regulator